jgi:aryl-alcohol dehydrogenase-like predicted oxidoreductase
VFAPEDHRSYNRDGSAFDVGETFSGVDFATGVEAAQEFSRLADDHGLAPAAAALAWIIQQEGVTSVIPGARSPEQARANAAAASAAPLGPAFMEAVNALYDTHFRPTVHPRW